MAVNAKSPAPKMFFGPPLLKSNNNSSEPQVERKLEKIQGTRDFLDNTILVQEMFHLENISKNVVNYGENGLPTNKFVYNSMGKL